MWRKQFDQAPSNCLYDMLQTSDGGFSMVGGDYTGFPGSTPWMAGLDKSGNVTWSCALTRKAVFTGIDLTKDNGLILVGRTQSWTPGMDDGIVLRGDKNARIGNSCMIYAGSKVSTREKSGHSSPSNAVIGKSTALKSTSQAKALSTKPKIKAICSSQMLDQGDN